MEYSVSFFFSSWLVSKWRQILNGCNVLILVVLFSSGTMKVVNGVYLDLCSLWKNLVLSQCSKLLCFQWIILFGRGGENFLSSFMVPFFCCFIHCPLLLFSPFATQIPRSTSFLFFFILEANLPKALSLSPTHFYVPSFKSVLWSTRIFFFCIFRLRMDFLPRMILSSSYILCSSHSFL